MTPIRPEQEYLRFLAQGQFKIQRDRSTGRHFFYPRTVAPLTGAADPEWVDASGRGTVYATTTVRVRPPAKDYNVSVVELEEGPRLMTRVEQVAPQDVRIGMAVRARIAKDGETHCVVFDPVAETK